MKQMFVNVPRLKTSCYPWMSNNALVGAAFVWIFFFSAGVQSVGLLDTNSHSIDTVMSVVGFVTSLDQGRAKTDRSYGTWWSVLSNNGQLRDSDYWIWAASHSLVWGHSQLPNCKPCIHQMTLLAVGTKLRNTYSLLLPCDFSFDSDKVVHSRVRLYVLACM